jgi:hypothetical protein
VKRGGRPPEMQNRGAKHSNRVVIRQICGNDDLSLSGRILLYDAIETSLQDSNKT